MFNQCRHIKTDGQRCRAAVLHGKPYCFFHMKFERMHKRDTPEIPPIEDSTSIFLAIGQIVRALNYEAMDTKRAGLMLYGLQIASGVAARLEKAAPVETVRSVHNLAGDPLDFTEAGKFGVDMLAPVDSACEPPQDYANRNQNGSSQMPNTPSESNVIVDHETAIKPECLPVDRDAPEGRYSVEEMKAVLSSPITDPAEYRKCVHAYSEYLDEEMAKQPPPKYLSINAQAVPTVNTPPLSNTLGAPGPCVRTWESEDFPSQQAGAPSKLCLGGNVRLTPPLSEDPPTRAPVACPERSRTSPGFGDFG